MKYLVLRRGRVSYYMHSYYCVIAHVRILNVLRVEVK